MTVRARATTTMIVLTGLLVATVVHTPDVVQAATAPPGFTQSTIATDIQNAVGMEVSPDGRLFVLAGNVRRIEIFDDSGYLGNFLELPQAANLGSGLLGLAFAPDFTTSGQVYVSYITDPLDVAGPQRFRLSRYDSDGSSADPSSEQVLFEVNDIDPSQQQHQGGDVGFGPDGKLYWVLGDRVKGTTVAQPLNSLFGKALRLNADGSIPTDNPYYDVLDGDLRAIVGNGLRNPYRMEGHPITGELYMSEVGPTDWEEINQIVVGANYGWPAVSGVVNDPRYTDPVHAYSHDPDGCAITGGAFYIAQNETFPEQYRGDFFYGDHCFGWIEHLDLETGAATRFLTGAHRLVEVKISPVTGALYYLDREYNGDTVGRTGGVGRIQYTSAPAPLTITRQPSDVTASVGETVMFDVQVSGVGPFGYQWQRDGSAIDGEVDVSLDFSATEADDGAVFSVVVNDATGASVTSAGALLSISSNTAPVPVISLPATDLRYVAGESYQFAGSATDAEDGTLDPASLRWEIVFHHDEHTHPFISELAGVSGGTLDIPFNDETAPDVFYRIHLTATDSAGTSVTVSQDVLPKHVQVTLDTEPSGLSLLLDGSPITTPATFTAVAGIERVLEAPAAQTSNGSSWTFASWSDGGARQHAIRTPLEDGSFSATYQLAVEANPEATITSPQAGSLRQAPVRITGDASDDLGVAGVEVVIKKAGTSEYWNGSQFIAGWSRVAAELSDPGSPTTSWSYDFAPPTTTAVKVTVGARDVGGTRGVRTSRNFTATVGSTPVAPEITLDEPAPRSTQANPVTFSGSVVDDDLAGVSLVVKKRGAKEYWNGAGWQPSWAAVEAEVFGDQWTHELTLPAPFDLVVFARATDSTGLRGETAKVVVFVT